MHTFDKFHGLRHETCLKYQLKRGFAWLPMWILKIAKNDQSRDEGMQYETDDAAKILL